VSWLTTRLPFLARARRSIEARAGEAWRRDRASLRGVPALVNRGTRIVVHVARGVVAHRTGFQAMALTYITVFAAVPLIVVVLSTLRLLRHLPAVSPELPYALTLPTGNQLLHVAIGKVLQEVNRMSGVTGGVVGLGVLLFTTMKLLAYTEWMLSIISGTGQRAPKLWRALVYFALLLVPLGVLAVAGLMVAAFRTAPASGVWRLIASIPRGELIFGLALAFAALWLTVTLLYFAAARARLPFSSAAFGASLAAVSLIVIFWVFANFQVGAARTNAVVSGFTAVPVALLWLTASWSAVLVGAELAVAHQMDRVLIHGAASFRLDGLGERRAAVAIMVRLTVGTERDADQSMNAEALGAALRLPPPLVRDLCFRLADRGLLSAGPQGFRLKCDPDRVTSSDVETAIDRDPALDGTRLAAATPGATLRDLAVAGSRR
jgi:YihY family inner membrane protein